MNRLKRLFYKYFVFKYVDNEIYITKKVLQSPYYTIGERTYGKPEVFFPDSGSRLVIGNYCSISEGVKIFLGGNHRVEWVSTFPFSEFANIFDNGKLIKGHPSTKGDVVIGNDVWIGYGVTILSGVTIEDGAVIAANSCVTKNVNAYEIVAGNPAKPVKKRFDDASVKALLNIQWWNWDEQRINQNLPLICSNNIEAFLQQNQ
jgi:acetyltransferase-like isoleucine patch superfamily enzyme